MSETATCVVANFGYYSRDGAPLRSWEGDALYHVIFKGNFGQPIVGDTKERRELQGRLDAAAAKYNVIVLAFCCMDTHVHLLIRVGDGDVSKAMQELIGGYSRWRNFRHRVRGNLFRSRFWSKLVGTRGVLVTARYIELNPVAAGMRSSPEDWEWSSCRAHLGRAHPPGFLAYARVPSLVRTRSRTSSKHVRTLHPRRHRCRASEEP